LKLIPDIKRALFLLPRSLGAGLPDPFCCLVTTEDDSYSYKLSASERPNATADVML